MPYNSRVFKEFGGGVLHFCGRPEHQIENLAKTEGLVGVNNCCMGNFRQVYRMQEAFAGRIALHVCDYTPLDVESDTPNCSPICGGRGPSSRHLFRQRWG